MDKMSAFDILFRSVSTVPEVSKGVMLLWTVCTGAEEMWNQCLVLLYEMHQDVRMWTTSL